MLCIEIVYIFLKLRKQPANFELQLLHIFHIFSSERNFMIWKLNALTFDSVKARGKVVGGRLARPLS